MSTPVKQRQPRLVQRGAYWRLRQLQLQPSSRRSPTLAPHKPPGRHKPSQPPGTICDVWGRYTQTCQGAHPHPHDPHQPMRSMNRGAAMRIGSE
ncbi:hypothetical protein E2C01_082428 [Portunus trituberculatus]|uniref:Uncharacterized protein n=1 Tax=Portunus trituberculatus TaxID=210409 RepID=A0A5B7IUJ1_PORTR|nr:hypothetical protein [Portunus trituberculatus]